MAVLIKSDGSQHDYPNYTTLAGKQAAVGGLIQPVYLDNKLLLVNEEGLIHQLPVNETASATGAASRKRRCHPCNASAIRQVAPSVRQSCPRIRHFHRGWFARRDLLIDRRIPIRRIDRTA